MSRDHEVALSDPLQIEQSGQITAGDGDRHARSDHRMSAKGDAEAGGGQHRQIVGAVADGERRARREAPGPRQALQQRALAPRLADRLEHAAGQTAAPGLETIGLSQIEADGVADPVDERRDRLPRRA